MNKTIIVALTADESPEMATKIESLPFFLHFSRLMPEHTKLLL